MGRAGCHLHCCASQLSHLIVLEFSASRFSACFHSETAFRCPRQRWHVRVRFTPESGHSSAQSACPLSAKSGHDLG